MDENSTNQKSFSSIAENNRKLYTDELDEDGTMDSEEDIPNNTLETIDLLEGLAKNKIIPEGPHKPQKINDYFPKMSGTKVRMDTDRVKCLQESENKNRKKNGQHTREIQ